MTRLITRLLAMLGVAAMLLFVPVSSASASATFDTGCKDAPTPEAPGRGATSILINTPTTLPTGPSWANGRPVFEHYAYAGLRWNNYDVGCGLTGLASDSDSIVGKGLANWLLEIPKFMVGVTNFVVEMAYHPTFLQTFDPLVETGTAALRTAVFDQWAGLFVVVAGLMLLWRARKMAASSAMGTLAWVLFVFVIASAVFQWPLKAGQVADQVVTTALGSVNSAINKTNQSDPAAEAEQNITGAVLFQQWKAGEFGSSDSPTANKYAQTIWESTTLTWAEAKTVHDDPDGAGKKLLKAKGDAFKKAADEIKDTDPDTYEYVTGKRSEARIAQAFVALLAALVTCPFLLMSSLLILAAFLIVRFAVVFFPVIATLAVFDKFHGMLKGLATTVMAALMNCIAFGIGSAVTILGIDVLLSPTSKLNGFLTIVLVGLFTFIMWRLLKPFRRLTVMVSPTKNLFGDAAGTVGEAGRNSWRMAKDLGVKMAASYLGGAMAAAKLAGPDKPSEDEPTDATEETPATRPDTQPPLAIVAPPTHRPAIGTGPVAKESGPYERPAGTTPDPAPLPPGPSSPAPAAPTPVPTGAALPAGSSSPGTGAAPERPSIATGPAPVRPIAQEPAEEQPQDEPGTLPEDRPGVHSGWLHGPADGSPAKAAPAAGDQPEQQVWTPGDSAQPHPVQPPRVADPEIDEKGDEVHTVWVPREEAERREGERWW